MVINIAFDFKSKSKIAHEGSRANCISDILKGKIKIRVVGFTYITDKKIFPYL